MKLYCALIGLSLILGSSFVFIEYLIRSYGVYGVWITVFIRCLAGSVTLLPVWWLRNRKHDQIILWKTLRKETDLHNNSVWLLHFLETAF
ncbi:hypothetical protein HLI_12705 [Halobacillus litoralis]|uniref:EamA domain-containing protein n=1 Tax=Halobacillus litoralis TaxID=45668 RepID=A0A410ME60_9BACI|nr:hypothetical protein HLI_12705 [Halobacillus litoralis]